MQAGAGIFSDQCQACHNEGGAGVAQLFAPLKGNAGVQARDPTTVLRIILDGAKAVATDAKRNGQAMRSEEHTSELQSLMRSSSAVFCLKNIQTLSNNNKQ